MRNPELESRTLFAVKLVLVTLSISSGCQRGPDTPQTGPAHEPKATAPPVAAPPPPLPPLPKPPPVVGRPPNRPCWLIVKRTMPDGDYDNRGTVYELSYGPDGRLESATQWPFKTYCVGEGEENCIELHGEPAPRLRYQYDLTTGRLSGVTANLDAGRTGQLTLSYDPSGQLDRYQWTEQAPGGQTWRTETTLAFDGTRRPAARLSKGKTLLKKKVVHALELSRLEGASGPFTPKTPIIWPDSPSEVFIGWTFRETLGKVEGTSVRDEEESVWVGDDGRIRHSTYRSRGKADRIRVFAYECPKEGDFRRIPWKTWVPGDTPDFLPTRNGGVLPQRAALLGSR